MHNPENFQLQELHESIDKLLGIVQRGQSLCASAANDVARDKFNDGINALPRWIRDRLGLSARPKVEDVEEMLPISITSAVTAKAKEWKDRTEAAEAKLAEREAELAKADAVVADYAFGKDIVGGAPFPGTVMEFSKAELDAMSRHAARQQQKD